MYRARYKKRVNNRSDRGFRLMVRCDSGSNMVNAVYERGDT